VVVLLAELVAASDAAAATRSRKAKCAAFADVLRRLAPDEVEPAVGFLIGWPRQGKVGVGWGSLGGLSVDPAGQPTLSVAAVDAALARLATTSGSGSQAARREQLLDLLGAATAPEQSFLQRLLLGELRQGALEGLLTDAVAEAARVPAGLVRRAAMLSGDLGRTAEVALHGGGAAALAAVGLTVQRPLQPMLAATAASVSEAIAETGLASVEWKLDGARVQLHKDGDEVRAFTRNLNEVTSRLPGVVRAVQGLRPRGWCSTAR
jgi:DNA ligase 1